MFAAEGLKKVMLLNLVQAISKFWLQMINWNTTAAFGRNCLFGAENIFQLIQLIQFTV